jgi:hypothetical protein
LRPEGLEEEIVAAVEPERRGPKPLADLVRSESARLIPILNAATDK